MGWILPLWILLLRELSFLDAMDVTTDPEVTGYIGEQVELKCTFRSSVPVSQKLTVTWFYRPQSGGTVPVEVFFYQSMVYPSQTGPFKDRISWIGNVDKGDASIAIKNLTVNDNGTFSCTVKNPPDVYSELRTIILTITTRVPVFKLSAVSVLSLLVLIPSLVVVTVMLVRMGRQFGILEQKTKRYKKSSIEVSENEDPDGKPGLTEKICLCCVSCLEDSEDEDEFLERMNDRTETEQ
ncbi:myelin protein zero-like protein 3 isoform X2 [Latimeria chalumnae]|uniref:myelin protein zero-like protein 3 isoform X2 n=1 Tax=Latimeria chalumnae TaxID=7897 RepID=UPI0003C16C01|nr:PREDICTED: myelin protein zero-like protein 3 isoform X2 [Latimeria chalumnae]|eukprot:XP_005988212.1 PREDICTED: myelin protein zero-like protein 3 isoform X2 [Latimeria chalumnae]